MKLREIAPGQLQLSGELTMATVAGILPELEKAIGNGAMTIDLAGVSLCDSAALALLLALKRRQDSRSLQWNNLPLSLLRLARLYELDSLLDLPEGQAS